jgi:hypothetical protein
MSPFFKELEMTEKERTAIIEELLEARQEELEGKKCWELFTDEEWEEMREEKRQDALRRYTEKLEEKDDDWLFGFSDGYDEIAGEAIEARIESYQSQLEDMDDEELEALAASSAANGEKVK